MLVQLFLLPCDRQNTEGYAPALLVHRVEAKEEKEDGLKVREWGREGGTEEQLDVQLK